MRRLRQLALALVTGLVALEVALQIGALVAALAIGRPDPAGAGALVPTVLCIGDSYTYGLGASSTEHSYPMALQRLLRERQAPAATVINAGWPGRNSREALLQLQGQLAEHRPRLVCVLIGLNDSWTHPRPVEAAELAAGASSGWQLRWRTWRLLQVLCGGGGTAAVPAPRLEPASPAASPAPATGTKAFLQQVAARVKAGEPAAALAMLEQALARDPANAADYHQGLAIVQTSLGRRDQAAASLAWLQREYQERPTRQVAEAYAMSLYSTGERQQAATVARGAAPRFGDCSPLWWLSGQGYYEAGDLAAAERELDRAIATAAGSDADWRATVRRDCARAACGRDLGKAMRLLLAALQLDGDVERCRLIVEGAKPAFAEDAVRRTLQELAPAGRDLELLQRLFGNSWGDRSGMCAVLDRHLREIVRLCREHGAGVVLLTYPLPVDDVEAVYAAVAGASAVPLVRCLPAFEQELRHRARDELYIRDGHCTDAGYALMAQVALEPVLRELQR